MNLWHAMQRLCYGLSARVVPIIVWQRAPQCLNPGQVFVRRWEIRMAIGLKPEGPSNYLIVAWEELPLGQTPGGPSQITADWDCPKALAPGQSWSANDHLIVDHVSESQSGLNGSMSLQSQKMISWLSITQPVSAGGARDHDPMLPLDQPYGMIGIRFSTPPLPGTCSLPAPGVASPQLHLDQWSCSPSFLPGSLPCLPIAYLILKLL